MRSMSSDNVYAKELVVKGESRRVWMWITAAIGLVVLYAALAFGIYSGLTRTAQGANDFYSRWMGARALFVNGQNPYSDAVTRDIQMGMYGRLARPDEDQVAFAYPLFAAYIAAPLVLLPYPMAQALWMALLVVGVVAGALALAKVNQIPLSPGTLAFVLLGVLLFYPTVRGIMLGQYALVSFACVAIGILMIAEGRETSAGVLLALAAVKPQPIVLLLPVILMWAWWNRKRSVVWSAFGTLGLLVISSFLLVPTWVSDFLAGLGNYARYAPVGPPLETFFTLLLPGVWASVFTWGASAALLMWAGVVTWRTRNYTWYEFQPTLGFVALVTTLAAGRIGTPDQVLLLLPWMAWFGVWRAQGTPVVTILCAAALLAIPWFVFLRLLEGNREAIVVTTLLPVLTLGVYLIVTLFAARPRGLAT